MSAALALDIENDNNIVQLEVIHGKIGKKQEVKYNLDGSVKRTRSNAVKGASSEVFAFKTKDEIKKMVDVLNKHIEEASGKLYKQYAERNKLLFLIGINIGIRASDIVNLKWNFFFKNMDCDMNNKYTIQPKKTKKYKKFVTLYFNNAIKKAVLLYVQKYPFENLDDYIFVGKKGNEPILPKTVLKIVKQIAKEAGIEQNIGSHSLRKTWGYWCWHTADDKEKALVILQQCFGHSSTKTTAKYIGLLDEEVENMYKSINLGVEFM